MLGEGGVALGVFPDAEFDVRALGVEPGDVILLYTDGVTDTIGKDGEMFEIERLIEVLHRNADQPSESIIDAIRLALDDYADPTAPVDDVTLVCVRVEEPPPADTPSA